MPRRFSAGECTQTKQEKKQEKTLLFPPFAYESHLNDIGIMSQEIVPIKQVNQRDKPH